MRIAKYIAHCGYCSRRDAEKLLFEGKVFINGQVVTDPATKILDDRTKVSINKNVLSISSPSMWLYHKPPRLITSRRDEKGRETVFDQLPEKLKNLVSVGRLDYNSEGLLLLTNNGDLARYLEMPENNLIRKYRVRAFGRFDFEEIKNQLKLGIIIDGVSYKSIELTIESQRSSNIWFTLLLQEGKNREIRKIFEYFELSISKLIRIEYGLFKLGDLAVNSVKKVPQRMVDFYMRSVV